MIDFLENKSIFSQTKYTGICFSQRATCGKNISEIHFSALAKNFQYCLILVNMCS